MSNPRFPLHQDEEQSAAGPDRAVSVADKDRFAEFSRWLDAELAKLETRFSHLASPQAQRRRQRFRGV
jgi:hypothetical protein